MCEWVVNLSSAVHGPCDKVGFAQSVISVSAPEAFRAACPRAKLWTGEARAVRCVWAVTQVLNQAYFMPPHR